MDHSVISVKWHVRKINKILAYQHHRLRSPAEQPAATTSLISRILAKIFKGPAWCKHSLPPINAPLPANRPEMRRIHPSLLSTALFLGRRLIKHALCDVTKGTDASPSRVTTPTALFFFPSHQHINGWTKHQLYQQAVNRGICAAFLKICDILRDYKVFVGIFTMGGRGGNPESKMGPIKIKMVLLNDDNILWK